MHKVTDKNLFIRDDEDTAEDLGSSFGMQGHPQQYGHAFDVSSSSDRSSALQFSSTGNVSRLSGGDFNKVVGSEKSLSSQLGSGLSLISGGSLASIWSQGSDHHEQGSGMQMMGSAQYLDMSSQMSELSQQTTAPPKVKATRPQTLPLNQPVPQKADRLKAEGWDVNKLVGGPAETKKSADEIAWEKKMALQKAHMQEKHVLYVNQLLQQIEVLTVDDKRQVLKSLRRSAPELFPKPVNPDQGARAKTGAQSAEKSAQPSTSLPYFFSGDIGATKLDQEHLKSLKKNFGHGFAENILPLPILMPTVLNPWAYKTYPISISDVCYIDKYMEKKGRNAVGVANIGGVINESVHQSRDTLKLKINTQSKGGQGENKLNPGKKGKPFESTQSLGQNRDAADVMGPTLAQQMGQQPITGPTTAPHSCWEGTGAAADTIHAGAPGNSIPKSAQFRSKLDDDTVKYISVKDDLSEFHENMDGLCAPRRKKKCTIS